MEQPFQLAHRHFIQAGQLFQTHRFFQVGFHDRHHLAELGLRGPQLAAQRHPLLLARPAYPIAQQQFGSPGGDFGAVGLAGHQLQGHVHGRHATRAGVAVAVQLEQLVGNNDAREALLQRFDVFPVNGAAVALEQVGAGQQVAAGADATQGNVLVGQLAQPVQQDPTAVVGDDGVGADDEEDVQRRGVFDRVIGQYAHAIAGSHRVVIGGNDDGSVEGPVRGHVGHAQGFHCRRKADSGEVRQ
ncbi:hypothetical protein D3C85_1257840 [compost metagenome]